MSLLAAVALEAGDGPQPFRLKHTREAIEHPTIPQDAPGGLTVRYRLNRGPIVEKSELNNQFDRVAETAKLLHEEGRPLERIAAVKELVRYPGDRTLYALILALRDQNPNVREHAAIALGDLGDVRAVKPLIDMLGYSDPRRAAIVARALEKLTQVHDLDISLEAWETWYEAYRRWPHDARPGK